MRCFNIDLFYKSLVRLQACPLRACDILSSLLYTSQLVPAFSVSMLCPCDERDALRQHGPLLHKLNSTVASMPIEISSLSYSNTYALSLCPCDAFTTALTSSTTVASMPIALLASLFQHFVPKCPEMLLVD